MFLNKYFLLSFGQVIIYQLNLAWSTNFLYFFKFFSINDYS
ncbi:hypothetical protein HMPREF1383_01045 [Enterococcus faecium V689]|uniref:Uncharacterized protein n=1 Tax=Enterococcus faecium R496 TaxID=1134836 RepID=A0AAV3GRA6_ENTFC|nr:hypothetical protein HMPREF1383_01045 [Enterococcus faecium V689]EJX47669.1 hypothetical protein HMPREF1378_03163 [Enterococcus faecium R496]EJX57811.1 hypothetical protein HMPREF1379_00313 [Enterococcus faecium R497]EJX77556.1 hypothetical protein HMPREF1372_01308 [Enterococcus faecium P1139]EJX82457.1 hypothetical protein HMPREF1370_01251 [Enterococcus faecium P1123]EJX91648.1 hypothetical protein HMPREF1367_00681 [Enterococcus faecium ERV38]EJY37128.1 hypothetical protein HMPREF1352_014